MTLLPGALLASAIAVVLAAGCARGGGAFFPLEPGAVWIYRVETATMDLQRTTRYVVENVGRVPLNGEVVSARRSGGGATWYYRGTDGGVARVAEAAPGRPARLYAAPVVVLPESPAHSPAPWNSTEFTELLRRQVSPKARSVYAIRVQVPIRNAVERSDDTVEVPAGRFEHCLRVHGTGSVETDVGYNAGSATIRVDALAWYAPGVGLVKSERRETTSTPLVPAGTYRMVLERFQRG